MKKTLMSLVAATAITSALVAGPTVEEITVEPELTGFYVGAGYAFIDGEATDVFYGDTAEVQNNAIDLRAGYNFNDYVAVEGRYAIGAKDTLVVNGLDTLVDGDFDTWGIFVKPQYPIGDASVYALLGYGNVTGTVSDTFDSVEAFDENGFQWGLGAKYAVTTNVEVFADYIKAFDDTVTIEGEDLDFNAYTVSVGVNYKF